MTQTATAVHIAGPGILEISEAAVGEVGPVSVRVDVILSGLCGSDVKMFRGGDVLRPNLFGHEWVGRVAEVGSEVMSTSVGDRVVVSVPAPCGSCAQCRRARGQFCVRTTDVVGGRDVVDQVTGGLTTSLCVPEYRVLPVHPGITDIEAALVEPASVALRGVRASGCDLGDIVVVQGAGPIGLLALQLAKASGAGTAIVVEPSPRRRDLASSLGADIVVTPHEAQEAVLEATSGLGADVVFECSGLGELVQVAVGLCRRGGTMALLGFALGDAVIEPATWVGREITVVATAGYSRAGQRLVMDLMATGTLATEPIHSRTIGFPDLQGTLEAMAAGESVDVKVLVDPHVR